MSLSSWCTMMRARTRGDDAGLALVLVLGFAAVLGGLIVVGTTIGARALTSSRDHADFEGALAVAETGVDATLALVNTAFNSTPSTTYVSPAACGISTAPATFASADAERRFFRDALTALPASCLKTTPSGQYVAVRPTNKRAVYSMSWVPRRGVAGAEKRLIKAEYLFAPYKPSNAVLTQGNLDFSGSVAIRTLTSAPSDVHTNGTVTGQNGSTQIQGALSSSASTSVSCPAGVTGGCTPSAPVQSVPNISARAYYSQATDYATTWFDLCPDGTMHSPGASGPCTGPTLSGTNDWVYTPGSGTTAPLWLLPRTAANIPGVYYVYQGDAQLGGNGNSSLTRQITVLAEAAPTGGTATSCSKKGGNVAWKLFNMVPWLTGLQLLADANITGDANASAGSGLFLAGHKVDLNTSSATITGSVVAGGVCPAAGTNTIQGVTINYDDTLESPLSDVIRTSLWLDYAAG